MMEIHQKGKEAFYYLLQEALRHNPKLSKEELLGLAVHIAEDVEGSEYVGVEHLSEAIQYSGDAFKWLKTFLERELHYFNPYELEALIGEPFLGRVGLVFGVDMNEPLEEAMGLIKKYLPHGSVPYQVMTPAKFKVIQNRAIKRALARLKELQPYTFSK